MMVLDVASVSGPVHEVLEFKHEESSRFMEITVALGQHLNL